MKISMFYLLGATALGSIAAEAKVFTDDQGRQVDAEIVGIRGENVVLAVKGARGQWPIKRLSASDQEYVQTWRKSHTAVRKMEVWATEKEGIGERGEFAKSPDKNGPIPPADLPIAPAVDAKTSFRHYGITVSNTSPVDAGQLKAAYVIYVIQADGTIGISPGVQTIAEVPAGKKAEIQTEAVTATRTKATKLRLSISNNSLSASEKTVRSKEQFGGIWVRLSGPDGARIGECRQLTPELTKLDPPWEEAEVTEEIPLLNSFEDFIQLLKKSLPASPPDIVHPKQPGALPLPPR